ncbi:MAG TPA: hypothetical protein VJ949_08340 [Cryomorphaceae bacterium]|nr:hypothetical protein [Cryomorphaceae bacterium]
MKKRILIFSTLFIAASLTAFSFIGDRHSTATVTETPCKTIYTSVTPIAEIFKPPVLTDFFYDFGPRFNPITKRDLANARTVSDFIDEKEVASMDGVRSTAVIIIKNDIQTDIRVFGKSERLTQEQLALIGAMEYSSNFLVQAEFHTKDANAELKGENIYRPHMTVVPEKQASYDGGRDALLDYFRKQNEKNIYNLDEEKLQPAKLHFTVTKNGTVEDVSLDRTSGYSNIDETMIRLANDLPGEWQPAENAKGEKVDQTLVVSFGIVGC